jgi:hypothetical protein
MIRCMSQRIALLPDGLGLGRVERVAVSVALTNRVKKQENKNDQTIFH